MFQPKRPFTTPRNLNSDYRYKSHDGYMVNVTEHSLREPRASRTIGLSLLFSPLPHSGPETANKEVYIQEFLDAGKRRIICIIVTTYVQLQGEPLSSIMLVIAI